MTPTGVTNTPLGTYNLGNSAELSYSSYDRMEVLAYSWSTTSPVHQNRRLPLCFCADYCFLSDSSNQAPLRVVFRDT